MGDRNGSDGGTAAAWVAAALLLAILVLFAAIARSADLQAGELTVCRSAKPPDRAWWSWREVNGRRCWYRGSRHKPKSELTWMEPRPEAAKPEGGEADDGRGTGAGSGGPHNAPPLPPPRPKEEARALTADDLLANTCCWPELEADIDTERKALRAPIPVPHYPAQPAPQWSWLWVLLAPAGYIAWVMLNRLASKTGWSQSE